MPNNDKSSTKAEGGSSSVKGSGKKSLKARAKGMVKGIRKSTKKLSSKASSSGRSTASKSVVQIEIEKEQYPVKEVTSSSRETTVSQVTDPPTPGGAAAAASSTATTTTDTKTFQSLQLVLLLMDPKSRRFELLQLEFDSEKARVADIIAQIPISVTEADIRAQSYEYVLDESATMRGPNTRLLDFCEDGKHVLVAVPTGTPIKDCVRLARPILSDPQVVKMLNMSGFNVDKWNEKTQAEEAEVKSRGGVPVPGEAVSNGAKGEETKESSKPQVYAPIIPIIAFLVLVLQTYHNVVTTPIQVGAPLGPGTYRYKCGLASFSPFEECRDAHLEVNDDGTVSIFNDLNELDMLLVGGVCGSDTEDCVDGIVLEDDGKVYIGGKLVKSIARFDDELSLSPWPFEAEPKLKTTMFSKGATGKM